MKHPEEKGQGHLFLLALGKAGYTSQEQEASSKGKVTLNLVYEKWLSLLSTFSSGCLK